MSLIGEQVLLRAYLQSADRAPMMPTYERIVEAARKGNLAGATVLRGIMGAGFHGIIRQSNCQPLRPCGECSLRVAMSSLPPLFALIPLKNERRRVPFCFRSYRMTFRSPGIEVPKASTTVDHGGSPSLSLYDGGILARKLGPCCSYPRKNKRWKSCIVDRLGMQNNESMILVARRCSSE